jgi:hypothetical protein
MSIINYRICVPVSREKNSYIDDRCPFDECEDIQDRNILYLIYKHCCYRQIVRLQANDLLLSNIFLITYIINSAFLFLSITNIEMKNNI